jgi:hypothetical protein
MSLLASVNESSPGNVYAAPTDTATANIGSLANSWGDLGFVASTYTASQTESFGSGVPAQTVRIYAPGYYAITTALAGANWSSTGTASTLKFQLYNSSTSTALAPIITYPLNILTTAGSLTQTIVIPLDPGTYTGLIILTVGGGETVSIASRTSIVSMTLVEVA